MNDNNGIQNIVEPQPTVVFDNQQVNIDVQSNIKKKSKLPFYLLAVALILFCSAGSFFVGKSFVTCPKCEKESTIDCENDKTNSNDKKESIEEKKDEKEIKELETKLVDLEKIKQLDKIMIVLLEPDINHSCSNSFFDKEVNVVDGNNKAVASKLFDYYSFYLSAYDVLEGDQCFVVEPFSYKGKLETKSNCGSDYNDYEIKKYTSYEKVNTYYHELTGFDMTLKENIGYCPDGLYDNASNRFYHFEVCGGTCGDYKFRYYIYDYTEDEDNYYVYVAYDVIENSTDMIDETNYLSHKKMKFYFSKSNDRVRFYKTININ